MTNPEISVILPCYNEIGNLEPLINEIRAALDPLNRSYEIIYVDDASNDGTTEKLRELAAAQTGLRTIRHKTNYGESAAILTGYENANGQIFITLDADLQNDPADMPEMLKRLEQVDCVCGVRKKRNDSFSKKASSRIANKVRAALLHDDIHDAGCTFRTVRREATKQLIGFRALHRFLPTMLRLHGYRVEEMPVNHRPRTSGTSKYGIGNRLWVGISDIFGMRWYRRRFFPPNRVE